MPAPLAIPTVKNGRNKDTASYNLTYWFIMFFGRLFYRRSHDRSVMDRATAELPQKRPFVNDASPMRSDCPLWSSFLMLSCIIFDDSEAPHENNCNYR
jgi:hypothetical protein